MGKGLINLYLISAHVFMLYCLSLIYYLNMILVIDNYDSFTLNIVSLLNILGYATKVVQNDATSIAAIRKLKPSKIVLSPGPGTPNEAGITLEAVDAFHDKLPMLGVCLGHQAIGQYFGGEIVSSRAIVHGGPVKIEHTGTGLFAGITQSFQAIRYNSLTVDTSNLTVMQANAWSSTSNVQEVMALQHPTQPLCSVQFHPESYGSEHGLKLLENFCNL